MENNLLTSYSWVPDTQNPYLQTDLTTWLTKTLAHTCLSHEAYSSNGFVELVDSTERPIEDGIRRVMPQARLAYVFTHAGLLGDETCALTGKSLVSALSKFWDPKHAGWVKAITVDGTIFDQTIDTYDQAFGLFALAWHFRATGDSRARSQAIEVSSRLSVEGWD